METSKSSTNPHVTDPTNSLSSTDKILIGVLVPVGAAASAGAAFIVYSRCFKVSSVAPKEDSDIDLENQNDTRSSTSAMCELQSSTDEIEETTVKNPEFADYNDVLQNTVDETTQ